MAVSIKESYGAFYLLFHMLCLYADLVACDAELSASQHTEIRLDEPIVEGIVIHHRGIVRAIRNRAVSAWRITFHDRLIAYIAHLNSRIKPLHSLVKLDKAKIPVYDIDIIFVIDFHSSVTQPFHRTYFPKYTSIIIFECRVVNTFQQGISI